MGLAAEWKVSDRLKIGTEYTFSYGDIAYNLNDGGLSSTNPLAASYFNVANLPSINSSMHSVKLHGEYKLADNVTLLAGYGFDLFKDNDWAYGWSPAIAATSAAGVQSLNTFTSAEAQPSYRVHSLYTSVRVKFNVLARSGGPCGVRRTDRFLSGRCAKCRPYFQPFPSV